MLSALFKLLSMVGAEAVLALIKALTDGASKEQAAHRVRIATSSALARRALEEALTKGRG